jgi:hypothetical protein
LCRRVCRVPQAWIFGSDILPSVRGEEMAGNLISNDPLVAAIFEAVSAVPAKPHERMFAVRRAGHIADAYIGNNTTEESRRVFDSTFADSDQSSPSKQQ